VFQVTPAPAASTGTIIAALPVSTARPVLVAIYPANLRLGACHHLGEQPILVGRDDTCDLSIPHASVSRKHARIEPSDSGYFVADLGSTNGTFLNNVRVSCSPLHDGDYVRFGVCIFRFLAGSNIEAEYHEEIYRLTITDALTNVANKRYLLDFLTRELARTARHACPLSVVMMDIHRFKAINDTYGHLVGDFVLRELADCIQKNVREEELFARYGGEEFALVLPETTRDQARLAAERFRKLIEDHSFEYEQKRLPITISLGVATTTGEGPCTSEDLLLQADANLYRAKAEGRNRVIA
jgi:diguanylate cyclase (GGDEF)-like protein